MKVTRLEQELLNKRKNIETHYTTFQRLEKKANTIESIGNVVGGALSMASMFIPGVGAGALAGKALSKAIGFAAAGAGVSGIGSLLASGVRSKANKAMEKVSKGSEELTSRVRDIKTVNSNANIASSQYLGNSKVYN